MANQDTPLWERVSMDYDLSPPWTLFNMAMALNLRLLIIPLEHRTIESGKALLMVNNRATYQRHSWIPEASTGEQALFIPTASDENCLVLAIFEQHKLNFNPHIILLMFTQDPEDCIAWDVHWQPIGQASGSMNLHMQHGWDLLKKGKCLRIYCRELYSFPARFEDAMPPKCEIICMWYEGTKTTLTYIIFDGEYPRVQLDHSFFYSSCVTAGAYWIAQLNRPITAPISLEPQQG